jgi:hypothetical protein
VLHPLLNCSVPYFGQGTFPEERPGLRRKSPGEGPGLSESQTELNGGKDMILILVVSIFTIATVTVTVEIRFGKNR